MIWQGETDMTYTVQFSQFGVTDVEDFSTEDEARTRYAEVCADADTTQAWIFDGPSQNATALEQFTR